MKPRFFLFWAALVAMWLALVDAFTIGDFILAALAAAVAVMGFALLQPPVTRLRRPLTAVSLLFAVLADIARSNMHVAGVVLQPGRPGRRTGFVDIPLEATHPAALAALACIVTSTPGTAWAGYDSQTRVLTLHVLDIVDEAALVQSVKTRYERPLMEIFE